MSRKKPTIGLFKCKPNEAYEKELFRKEPMNMLLMPPPIVKRGINLEAKKMDSFDLEGKEQVREACLLEVTVFIDE